MSSESPPAKKTRPRGEGKAAAGAGGPPREGLGLKALDVLLMTGFLGLTFLLGAFPLKDTDFWWHLRTGDMIRGSGTVPAVDPFTFGAAGRPWTDLHWVFQVAVSLIYERGGVRALTLAKCGVTCLAVFLLVTARRREWPLWAALAAWLPALLVLGGRMYVRPETLTLLYLSAFLAVLVRIDRLPWLAMALPVVQVAWVNTQGLFVLGPVVLVAALVDAVVRPGAFAPARRRWWRVVGAASALTGLACLINPYGLEGALYPIRLAQTMGNPVFTERIEELKPIPRFIAGGGLASLPFRLTLVAMALGVVSFVVPLVWAVAVRLRPAPAAGGKSGRSKKGKAADEGAGWRLSVFRLLLFTAFSLLSWRATRNSHQFAAVAGAVTAWNVAEWAAAVRRRRWAVRGEAGFGPGAGVVPRLVTAAAVAAVAGWVGSGRFYEAAREGRTVGLGEQPLWYPHEAVRFAGGEGMPPRFLGFHIGHASLYEYEFGPGRKVYVDARLEVIGPDLFEQYTELERRIADDDPVWPRELDTLGRPVVLADLEHSASVAGSLLTSADWRCVWLDPVATVFVHGSNRAVVDAHAVDFAGRHFRPEPRFEPRGSAALLASAKGLRNLGTFAARGGPGRVMPLVLLGLGHARRANLADPSAAEPWKQIGFFEFLREPPPPSPVSRFRMGFDPVFDLSPVRATYALRRALEAAPDDFLALSMFIEGYKSRGMTGEYVPLLDRLTALTPINALQSRQQAAARALRASFPASPGPTPPTRWENLGRLNQTVNELLAAGRASAAADVLDSAAPDGGRSWEAADRVATLRLHLGQPAEARRAWQSAAAPPRPGLREARVAVTELVECHFDAARDAFRAAAAANPDLFEAFYGLAVLEQDAGRATAARDAARRAVSLAPTPVARAAARSVMALATPYAEPEVVEAPRGGKRALSDRAASERPGPSR